MLSRIKSYFLQHKIELILIITITVVSAFFRLYKISDYMTFLGDEGRDMIVAKGILEGDFTLLGPRASAGDFFLGPIYYYMIAPFLFLARLDPVGPSVMVALFGVATVLLVYFAGLKLCNRRAGLIAASLYSISPLVIAYSRSSWNPNLMPFFSLLILFVLYEAVKSQSARLFIAIGFLIGIAIQLHYLTVFLGVIVLVYLIFGEFIKEKERIFLRYLAHGFEMLGGFILGISPFLLFEIRHGFPNVSAILKFVLTDNAAGGYPPGQSFLGNIFDVLFRLFGRLVTKFPPPEQVNVTENLDLRIWQIATVILAFFSIIAIIKIKDKFTKLLFTLWLVLGVFLFAFYRKPIYDYYLGFIFPLPFLLVGSLLSQTSKIKKYKVLSIGISVLVFVCLLILNLSGAPFLHKGNKQKDQAKNIAEFIISKTEGKPYNFALLTRGNSDHVYRYFLEVANKAPITILNGNIDPQRESVADQLIVVCEYVECQPLGNSLWEIAGFGRAEIVGEWEVPFVKIFKLVHFEKEESNIQEN